jgi:hypothetical protein
VLVGDLLDREDATVGRPYEEPRGFTKCRVAERLRRPHGVADEVEARRLHFRHRLADVVNDERDHDIGAVGDQPDIPMLVRDFPNLRRGGPAFDAGISAVRECSGMSPEPGHGEEPSLALARAVGRILRCWP